MSVRLDPRRRYSGWLLCCRKQTSVHLSYRVQMWHRSIMVLNTYKSLCPQILTAPAPRAFLLPELWSRRSKRFAAAMK
jgi:hypothetical protein